MNTKSRVFSCFGGGNNVRQDNDNQAWRTY